jgi:hypothetical protein
MSRLDCVLGWSFWAGLAIVVFPECNIAASGSNCT